MNRALNHKEASWAIRDLNDESISILHKYLLLIALTFCDKHFIFQKSQQDIAFKMRCCIRTVQRKIDLLAKKEYLTVLEQGSSITHKGAKYRLNVSKILSNLDPKDRQKILKATDSQSVGLLTHSPKATDSESYLATLVAKGPQTAPIAPSGAKIEEREVVKDAFDLWRESFL